MALNLYLSVLTLNVNGLNAPIKRHRVTGWIRKQDPCICCLQKTHFRPKDTFRFNTKTQNLWDAAKAVIRVKYIAIQAFLKKEERSQIHNLTLHLKELEKEQQIKPKTNRRQEITKIRAEINAIKTKTKTKQNKTKNQ